jgi:hypothetical protein
VVDKEKVSVWKLSNLSLIGASDMTLHSDQGKAKQLKITSTPTSGGGAERRIHRRYDLAGQSLNVNRWDGRRREAEDLGYLVDISAGGACVVTEQGNIKPDQQIRVRLEMPSYAGICPFIDTTGQEPKPKNEWIGWLAVSRVKKVTDNQFEVAGRLVDMDDMDRGMLGLYLSTQPLAA